MGEAVAGIVANPASGQDIRRLVARASVFPTAEKANMVQRLLSAFAVAGVGRVLVSTDRGGVSAAVRRALGQGTGPVPGVEFCDQDPLTGSAQDTVNAVRRMVDAGASVIVCLGGDGTARVAATACGDVPLLALSTGTDNAFPHMREATVAGLAAGFVATGDVDVDLVTQRVSVLEVVTKNRRENALVDVAVTVSRHIGAKALWEPAALTELYCTFAEPDGIGLSSIAGQLCPSPRSSADGVALQLGPVAECAHVVHAPIAPGLVSRVGVRGWSVLRPGVRVDLAAAGGVIAVDGERELELKNGEGAYVELRSDGPWCVDVRAVMAEAATQGLLRTAGRKRG
ncbi:ATP-NAD kinase family protein [Amycolatopsis jiangsuensis]|uniref:Putative polyphosphate/ATP-dependent NAD kinase n=1 Tax=Amycolatopsis jiangsuensis TaxID=1181879 RepID=A0A840IZJ9_9PSEU|nr:NAD(+)/NADH kinase [Amycolatopsis jiangsuensis]MBB4686717.1 putative polyphosphate/ATP-dependent NAD kinase [Amycolatopsis jiangsuensis]